MPKSTCNGLPYTRARDSGLGLQHLENIVSGIQTKTLFHLLQLGEVVALEVPEGSGMQGNGGLWPPYGVIEQVPDDAGAKGSFGNSDQREQEGCSVRQSRNENRSSEQCKDLENRTFNALQVRVPLELFI